MNNYVGNCANMIDWETIVETVSVLPGKVISADPTMWNRDNPEYKKIYDSWVEGKVNLANVQWINYYPTIDFNKTVEDTFANIVGVIPLRSWIARINQGFYAPRHWDIDDNEQEYLNKGTIKRFTCFIAPAVLGHVMAIDTEYFHTQNVGNIYKWGNYKDWHGAANSGFKPYYTYHLLGY